MIVTEYGVVKYTDDEVCELMYSNPDVKLDGLVFDPNEFNRSVKTLFADYEPLMGQLNEDYPSLEEFDRQNQNTWFMPDEYKQLDIARWVLSLCKTEDELQRVGQELLMYQERDLFDLLRFLKYFVDTMREKKMLIGVGRGSSIASYVLYLIGVHRINSLKYQIPIEEFLK